MEMQYVGVGIVMWFITLIIIWKMMLGDVATWIRIGLSVAMLPFSVGVTYLTLNR